MYSKLAYSRSCVCEKPKINYGCNTPSSAGATLAALSAQDAFSNTGDNAWDNIFVDGFWKTNYTCIFNMHISDVPMKSNQGKKPTTVPKSAETLKEKKCFRTS